MVATSTIVVEPRRVDAFNGASVPIAHVDLDRFCRGCGYNLRTLPVHRDERTGIPVVRCTECGRFDSANDTATALTPWLRHLTALVLVVWVLLVASVFAWLVIGQVAITYGTLDELTSSGGYTVQVQGNSTTRTWTSFGALQVKTDLPEAKLFVTVMLALSFAAACVVGLLAVVVMPHWRRRAYVAVVFMVPILVAALVTYVWNRDASHLLKWGLPYVLAHLVMQLTGGITGVALGRKAARLAVRIVFPPSVRPRLAYLWLADGKPVPGCV